MCRHSIYQYEAKIIFPECKPMIEHIMETLISPFPGHLSNDETKEF
jgi:hypothetical protein